MGKRESLGPRPLIASWNEFLDMFWSAPAIVAYALLDWRVLDQLEQGSLLDHVEFLIRVGYEDNPNEQAPDLRERARLILARYAAPELTQLLARRPDDDMVHAASRLAAFYGSERHAELPPRELENARRFAEACVPHDDAIMPELVRAALIALKDFEFISKNRMFSIIPRLYELLTQLPFCDSNGLEWDGWESLPNWVLLRAPADQTERRALLDRKPAELIRKDLELIRAVCASRLAYPAFAWHREAAQVLLNLATTFHGHLRALRMESRAA